MSKKTKGTKEELWKTVKNWIKKHKPSGSEHIVQSDKFAEAVYDLVCDACEIVGYTND